MKMRLGTTLGLLALLIAALAGPAYASGNGNGQASGNGQVGAAQNDSSGKAEAPGQQKKVNEPPVPGALAVDSNGSGPKAAGHGKPGSGGSPGVKPSSSTDHNVSAAAGSDATKLYGNGQTAGQIAIQHGASTSAVLYGPGNSQPHKVQPCGHSTHGKGGGPDVHSLKNKGAKECSSVPPSTKPKPAGDPYPTASTPGTSRVAPATATAANAKEHLEQDRSGGVMSAVAGVRKGTLPFTGFPLWSVALIALGLAALGVALRRSAAEVA